jgi:hypothetical protein
VGDDPQAVVDNRAALVRYLTLPTEPLWLNQMHGRRVVHAGQNTRLAQADAAIAKTAGRVCAVATADCLPVLFCDSAGTCVAAAHAGWRGLVAGVLTATVESLAKPAAELLAWLGPAIGPRHYEVGDEVRQQFIHQQMANRSAFTASAGCRWMADLYQLARNQLNSLGIEHIYGGNLCTYSDAERFFSYRRDGVTGRMASLIWIA